MNRRELLKQLGLAATAAVLLPSCLRESKKVSIALNNLKVTGDEEELMAALAGTMIPETDKPGAVKVGAHLFALVMVDDCTNAQTKEKFLKGMRSFDDVCEKLAGKKFSDANASERLDILKKIESEGDKLEENVKSFYWISKGYIVEGYTTSEYFLTNVKKYELVPGPNFSGCATL
jgi:hypothetical protein